MELVDVTVFYLELRERPAEALAPAPEGSLVLRVERPSVAYYRFLYNTIGEAYHWLSRRKMSDQELAVVIGDPQMELYVLHLNGSPAGMAELDCRTEQIELVQFGIMPEYIGQGLGKWFLSWTIDQAWSYRPQRLWLHTCTLDHPQALANYKKRGFTEFKQEAIRREL